MSDAVNLFVRLRARRFEPLSLALAFLLSCSGAPLGEIGAPPRETDAYVVNCTKILRNPDGYRSKKELVSTEHTVDKAGVRHLVSVTAKDFRRPRSRALRTMSCEYPADPFWWYFYQYEQAPPPFWRCRADQLWPDVIKIDGLELRHADEGVGRKTIWMWVAVAKNEMSATGSGSVRCGAHQETVPGAGEYPGEAAADRRD